MVTCGQNNSVFSNTICCLFLLYVGRARQRFKIVSRSDTEYHKYLSTKCNFRVQGRDLVPGLWHRVFPIFWCRYKQKRCVRISSRGESYTDTVRKRQVRTWPWMLQQTWFVSAHDLFGSEGSVLSQFGKSRDHDSRRQPPVVEEVWMGFNW